MFSGISAFWSRSPPTFGRRTAWKKPLPSLAALQCVIMATQMKASHGGLKSEFYVDTAFVIPYSAAMRWRAVIVLLVLGFSAIAPSSLPWLGDHGQKASIGTLDLCHAATPAIASSGEMPCLNETSCRPCQPAQTDAVRIEKPLFKPFVLILQEERPPKA